MPLKHKIEVHVFDPLLAALFAPMADCISLSFCLMSLNAGNMCLSLMFDKKSLFKVEDSKSVLSCQVTAFHEL